MIRQAVTFLVFGLGLWLTTSGHGFLLALGWVCVAYEGLVLLSLYGENRILVAACRHLAQLVAASEKGGKDEGGRQSPS